MTLIHVNVGGWRKVESGCEDKVTEGKSQHMARFGENSDKPKDEDTSSVVVTLGLDVCVGQQEHRQDNDDDIPSREDEPIDG